MLSTAARTLFSGSSPRARMILGVLLLLSLAALLAHAWFYRFLCDDAFISMRYARNLAEGHGLVFNPGGEAVEGYTNFLWVLLLAGSHLLGAPITGAALFLSFLATIVLWSIVVFYVTRLSPPERGTPWMALFPLVALATCRSVAVWSTSGLETRLFEVLVLGGILRMILETEAASSGRRLRPVSAALFALASLTRPEGILMALCAGLAALVTRRRRGLGLRVWSLRWTAVFALPVGAHLLFRLITYGQLVPNTYHVKVGAWWAMGLTYLTAFALEYALWLWGPLVLWGILALVRAGRGHIPLTLLMVLLPYALFVTRIGGDHFEFRPFDIALPLLFLLAYEGLKALSVVAGRWVAGLIFIVCLALIVELPLLAHQQFPRQRHISGYPGSPLSGVLGEGGRFLASDRALLYSLPGLAALSRQHAAALRRLTAHFVGVRQEEHALFSGITRDQGLLLRGLVQDGVLPAGTHIATSCVGAIPFYSRLRTLDRHGLTDANIARQPPSAGTSRLMAHDKLATLDYARRRGVDLWAIDPFRLVLLPSDSGLELFAVLAAGMEVEAHWAALPDDSFILAVLPQGVESASRRMPRLRWLPLKDLPRFKAALTAARGKGESGN